MAKRDKVLILGSGPIVIGQAASGSRRINDFACPEYFPKERVLTRVAIFREWISNRRYASVGPESKVRNDLLSSVHRDALEILRNHRDVDVALLVRRSTGIRAVEDDGIHSYACFQPQSEV
jgi:hypothetical protein